MFSSSSRLTLTGEKDLVDDQRVCPSFLVLMRFVKMFRSIAFVGSFMKISSSFVGAFQEEGRLLYLCLLSCPLHFAHHHSLNKKKYNPAKEDCYCFRNKKFLPAPLLCISETDE